MVDLKLDYGKDFLKEEVRCDYTIDSEMKRIWAVELDLVNELKRVCDKYGIQYFAWNMILNTLFKEVHF